MEAQLIKPKESLIIPQIHNQTFKEGESTNARLKMFADHPIFGTMVKKAMKFGDLYLVGSFSYVLQSGVLFDRLCPGMKIDHKLTSDADFLIDLDAFSEKAGLLIQELQSSLGDDLIILDQRNNLMPKVTFNTSEGRRVAEIVFMQNSADRVREIRTRAGQTEYIANDNLTDHLLGQSFRSETAAIAFKGIEDELQFQRLGLYPDTPIRVVNEFSIYTEDNALALIDRARNLDNLKLAAKIYYYIRIWNLRSLKAMIELGQEVRSDVQDMIFVEPLDIGQKILGKASELSIPENELLILLAQQETKYFAFAYPMVLRLLIRNPDRALRFNTKLFSALSSLDQKNTFIDFLQVDSLGSDIQRRRRELWRITDFGSMYNIYLARELLLDLRNIPIHRERYARNAGFELISNLIDNKSIKSITELFSVLIAAQGVYSEDQIISLFDSIKDSVGNENFIPEGWSENYKIETGLDKKSGTLLAVQIAKQVNPILNPDLYNDLLTIQGNLLIIRHPTNADISATFQFNAQDYNSTSQILPVIISLDDRIRHKVFEEITKLLVVK